MSPRKRSFLKLWMSLFGIILVVLILIFSLYLVLTGLKLNRLLTQNALWLGIFWVLVLTALVSGVLAVFQSVKKQHALKQLTLALQLLQTGHYHSELFDELSQSEALFHGVYDLQQVIGALQQKMAVMAEQAAQTENGQTISEKDRELIIEKERHRIARELHDSVSQQLFAASMMLSALREHADTFPEAYAKQLQVIEQTIHESQSEMRALLLHLRPTLLDGKDLKTGVESLLQELSTKVPLQIKYDIDDIHLPSAREDHLFRIVQELLSNVLRHAQAEHLEVYLLQGEHQIILRVIDDGVGFDMSQQKVGSWGLRNIRERIESMGGNVRVISFEGQGTRIEIRMPLVVGG